jgi:hypothetical protein
MKPERLHARVCLLMAVILPAGNVLYAQQEVQYIDHGGECTYFGARHKEFSEVGLQAGLARRPAKLSAAGSLTNEVTSLLPRLSTAKSGPMSPQDAATSSLPAGSNTQNTIDKYLFKAMSDAGVTPAEPATDLEFIRRVSLDLTGRVPTMQRVLSFVGDPSTDKRTALVEELLAKPEWVDKWSMFFGDLFKNNSNDTQINRYPQGRDAFYQWIRDSLTANKPYDQMAREMISARGSNTWQQGELNWNVGGRMTGGPIQDTWDQQATNVMETFLGLGNAACLECHNGRGHLDTLNLWAKNTARSDMWSMSAFYSQAYLANIKPDPAKNTYYWSMLTDSKRYPGVYPLNNTSGNRPNRTPLGKTTTVTPTYIFSGKSPAITDNYQQFLAKEVTSDFQFSRAAVNYVWKQFFGLGIVEPVNQFDLARLDPDNPPPGPWTLQPTNPQLLRALAQDFINSGYDLKALMREIVNSRAYQLSSRYDNSQWTPAMEPLFARKFVRRLWAEEIHDNIAQTSNLIPTYKVGDTLTVNWAMQFPETRGLPGGTVTAFLDSFLRGNRDDQTRNGEGSVLQALNLMNDPFVMARIKATGTADKASLLARYASQPDDQLVNALFLTVLSRYPTDDEKRIALNKLAGGRSQQAEDLLWSLYNKVDFIFNY